MITSVCCSSVCLHVGMRIEVLGLSVGACNIFFHVFVIFFLKKERTTYCPPRIKGKQNRSMRVGMLLIGQARGLTLFCISSPIFLGYL